MAPTSPTPSTHGLPAEGIRPHADQPASDCPTLTILDPVTRKKPNVLVGASRTFLGALAACVFLASCGQGDEQTSTTTSLPTTTSLATSSDASNATANGIRLVSAQAGAAIWSDAPSDLVILDVRTPEEFAEGHLEGAVMIDFHGDDFASQLGELDPDVPYLLYCRSGNRSGQTTEILRDLGFGDVADIDGGILAWADAGLPVVSE